MPPPPFAGATNPSVSIDYFYWRYDPGDPNDVPTCVRYDPSESAEVFAYLASQTCPTTRSAPCSATAEDPLRDFVYDAQGRCTCYARIAGNLVRVPLEAPGKIDETASN